MPVRISKTEAGDVPPAITTRLRPQRDRFILRKGAVKLFDDVLVTTLATDLTMTVDTDSRFNELLAQCDKLSLHLIIDQPSANAVGRSVTCDLYHSCDGKLWLNKGTIVSASAAANATVQGFGAEPGTTPMLSLAKIKISCTMATAGGNVHVVLWACMRDDG